METAQNILNQALQTVNTIPSYTKIRMMQFGEDQIYYVGNMELLSSTLIAALHDGKPSIAASSVEKVCLEQIKERKATLLVSDDVAFAGRMSGNVVLILSQGIKRAYLKPLLPAIREGRVLVLSMSLIDQADADNHETARRLLSALCYCAYVVECRGGTWHEKTGQWSNDIMRQCQSLYDYGKTIFIAPWHREHPAQHLVIKHEFGAVDLPESDDPANIFSFIPEQLPE